MRDSSFLDDTSSAFVASCSSSSAIAAVVVSSTLGTRGVMRALRGVVVFESDCMTQNDSEYSLRILSLILEELDDEGLFVTVFCQFRENEIEA